MFSNLLNTLTCQKLCLSNLQKIMVGDANETWRCENTQTCRNLHSVTESVWTSVNLLIAMRRELSNRDMIVAPQTVAKFHFWNSRDFGIFQSMMPHVNREHLREAIIGHCGRRSVRSQAFNNHVQGRMARVGYCKRQVTLDQIISTFSA